MILCRITAIFQQLQKVKQSHYGYGHPTYDSEQNAKWTGIQPFIHLETGEQPYDDGDPELEPHGGKRQEPHR